VGGDQNKESKGKTSFMCVKGEVYMKILKIIEIYIRENRNDNKQIKTELKTLEWWISGLMLDPLFLIISRLT